MLGTRIHNWIIRKELGGGTYGTVYLATNEKGAAPVAIKVLNSTVVKPDIVARFLAEARAAGKIKHTGVTKIIDADTHASGFHYLVMELLEGESLHARIARGPLPPWHAAELCRQAAQVLAIAHKEGIVHRDLKPENLFLVPEDDLRGKLRVKVLDFGVAKLTGTLALDKTLGTAGSPPYMSPEQWLAAPTIDGRADIYALGCVVFEMLTGTPPFTASNLPEFVTAHLHGPIPSVRSKRPEVPEAFDALLTRMLAKQPADRPADMSEVARLCEVIAQEPSASTSGKLPTIQGIAPPIARTPAPASDPAISARLAPTERPAPPIYDAFPSGKKADPTPPRVAAVGSGSSLDSNAEPRVGRRSNASVIAIGGLALVMLVVIGYIVVDHVRRPADPDPVDERFVALRKHLETANPWRSIPELPKGPQLTSDQITVTQYATYLQALKNSDTPLAGQPNLDLDTPPAQLPNGSEPMGALTIEQAREFCAAIGGELPSQAEWEKAASARGDIENADKKYGPLREWVGAAGSTRCGTYREDPNDKNKYLHGQCVADGRSERTGFRCAKSN